jgi:hypothetical protein
MKKIILFLLISISIMTNNSFATDVSACGTLNTGTYTLTQNLIATGNCFTLNDNNIILDLNGHTITGNGTNSGIILNAAKNNITVQNGIIKNFQYGIYQAHSYSYSNFHYHTKNISFFDNSYDVYVSGWASSRTYNFIDSKFQNRLYFEKTEAVNFESDTTFNHTSSKQFYISSVNLKIDTTQPAVVGYATLYSTATVNANIGESGFYVKDICKSRFTNVIGLDTVKLYQDTTVAGNCFTYGSSNLAIDLNGKSITGDGTGYAIEFAPLKNNITIQNGIIQNFTNGIYQSHSYSYSNLHYHTKSISFFDNSYDVYVSGYSSSRTYNFIDSKFQNRLYFAKTETVNFESDTTFNHTSSKQFYIWSVNLKINTTQPAIVGYATLYSTAAVNANIGESGFYVKDICKSRFTNVIGLGIVKLYQDTTVAGNCFTYGSSNLAIDLNGKSITGNGTGYAIEFAPLQNNITIQNGIIQNFTQGIYQVHSYSYSNFHYHTKNISFFDNSYDVYVSGWASSRTYNFIDTYFTNRYYSTNTETIKFEGVTIFSHTPDKQLYISSTNLIFNTTQSPIVGYATLTHSSAMNADMGQSQLYVKNLCASRFTKVVDLGTVKLYQNTTVSGNCFTYGSSNLAIDLNGKSITGDGTGYAIEFAPLQNNITIQNGIIQNFTQGIYQAHSYSYSNFHYHTKNISFFDNSYDVYVSGFSSSRTYNFIDSYFTNRYYSTNTETINFEEGTIFNHTPDKRLYISSTNLIFNTTQSPIVGYATLTHTTAMNADMGQSELYVKNLCASTFTRVVGLGTVKLYQNTTASGNCITIESNNVEIDLNGKTLTGDGTNNGITFHPTSYNNVKISNGIMQNFNNAVYLSTSSTTTHNHYINNVTFTGNTNAISYDSHSYSRNLTVTNCTINDDGIYLRRINKAEFTLNNITSGSLFDTQYITTLSLNKLIDGTNSVGNYWTDFNCNNISDNYIVEQNNMKYTICNSNDYTNTITDTAPIINIEIIPQNQQSQTQNNQQKFIMPFGSAIPTTIIILLYILILS